MTATLPPAVGLLPTLDEVRGTRLPITRDCTCGGTGTCMRCVLDDERRIKRAMDE